MDPDSYQVQPGRTKELGADCLICALQESLQRHHWYPGFEELKHAVEYPALIEIGEYRIEAQAPSFLPIGQSNSCKAALLFLMVRCFLEWNQLSSLTLTVNGCRQGPPYWNPSFVERCVSLLSSFSQAAAGKFMAGFIYPPCAIEDWGSKV